VTPELAVAIAIIAPVMTVAATAYRLGSKLNGLQSCLENMRKELDILRGENFQLSAEIKALRDLLTVIVTKER
jgi:uncharacterized protein YoxC